MPKFVYVDFAKIIRKMFCMIKKKRSNKINKKLKGVCIILTALCQSTVVAGLYSLLVYWNASDRKKTPHGNYNWVRANQILRSTMFKSEILLRFKAAP